VHTISPAGKQGVSFPGNPFRIPGVDPVPMHMLGYPEAGNTVLISSSLMQRSGDFHFYRP
jgi:hypothetical protein